MEMNLIFGRAGTLARCVEEVGKIPLLSAGVFEYRNHPEPSRYGQACAQGYRMGFSRAADERLRQLV